MLALLAHSASCTRTGRSVDRKCNSHSAMLFNGLTELVRSSYACSSACLALLLVGIVIEGYGYEKGVGERD
ncbi:Uncharacterized protein HZ326_0905 [Fusarium oxysporum f. sp. albedinis]|nr:Uncharacterized protein HZ326_0905 [Fusarium oxysporum f. sp. albedinis]